MLREDLAMQDYMHGDFFEKWDFISANDPTHGFVDYVTAETAWAERLIRNEGGRALATKEQRKNQKR